MRGLFFKIFLLGIVLFGFLIPSDFIFANDEIILKESEVEKIFGSIFKELTIERIRRVETITSREEAVIAIIKKSIQDNIAVYLFWELPKQHSLEFIKTTILLSRVLIGDVSTLPAVIGELERRSVSAAKDYAFEWLLQNEIKTSAGNLKITYPATDGKKYGEEFPYIIVYTPKGTKTGKAAIEIYSSKQIKAPKMIAAYQYGGGIDEIPPFIFRVSGTIEKTADYDYTYRWLDDLKIEIAFSNNVPIIEIKEPGFIEKWTYKITSWAKATRNLIDMVGDLLKDFGKDAKQGVSSIWTGVDELINKINPFVSLVEPGEDYYPKAEKISDIISEEPLENQNQENKEENEEINNKNELDLGQIQETIDDLSEQIDILAAEIEKLLPQMQKDFELATVDTNNQEQDFQEQDIIFTELSDNQGYQATTVDVCFVDVNTASLEELQKITGVGPVTAQKIIDSRPFLSIYDLTRVSGIGEATLQKIIGQNCAYVQGDTGFVPAFSTSSGGGGGGGGATVAQVEPKITLSFAENNYVDEVIKVNLNFSDFKDTVYDVKISIEQEGNNVSQTYNTKEDNWQSSHYYLKEVFSGTFFEGDFELKITEENKDFEGEADIIVRVRENGKTSYSELADKINIIGVEPKEESQEDEDIEGGEEKEEEDEEDEEENNEDENADEDGEENDEDGKEEDNEEENIEDEEENDPTLEVVINEIAWMGTKASSWGEWIELYNNTQEDIVLDGWKLIIGEREIILSGIIASNNFYLLEREEDATNILADFIYEGSRLSNSGEKIVLKNNFGESIDEVDAYEGWFAGTASPDYISMERVDSSISGSDPDNWADNNPLFFQTGLDSEGSPIFGTPKAKNSTSFIGKVIYVDDDFEDDVENNRYNTIQKGVDAAGSGYLVLVDSGEYNESVIIEKQIILKAIGSAVINPLDVYTLSAITINAVNGIVIDSFEIKNARKGIYLSDSSQNIIKNNVFNNIAFGIYLDNSDNNNIFNNNIQSKRYLYKQASCGIYLDSSNKNIIEQNIANDLGASNAVDHGPTHGICLFTSEENILKDNTAQNNKDTGDGIYLSDSHYNILEDNFLADNYNGINLVNSGNNNLDGNIAENNKIGIEVDYGSVENILENNLMNNNCIANFNVFPRPDANNNVSESNLIDGKIVYYLQGQSDLVFDFSSNVALIYCFDCQNITIKDLVINSRNNIGIYFYNTIDSVIENVEITESINAINIEESDNNIIKENIIKKNFRGISLSDSNNNKIFNNLLEENDSQGYSPCFGTAPRFGLSLGGSAGNEIYNNIIINNPTGVGFSGYSGGNTFFGNDVKDNEEGIAVYCSSNNLFYHNNFIDNNSNVWGSCVPESPKNEWHNDSLKQGNHYSDYCEPEQGCEDENEDGICDDYYPKNGDEYSFLQENGWLDMGSEEEEENEDKGQGEDEDEGVSDFSTP